MMVTYKVLNQEPNVVKYLSQSVGSGKTHAIIKKINAVFNRKYIYVAPTIRLLEEIERRFNIHAPAVPVVRLFKNDAQNKSPVWSRAIEFLREKEHRGGYVCLLTTETFRRLVPILTDDEASQITVFLDEGIQPLERVSITGDHLNIMTDKIVQGEDLILRPKKGCKKELEEIAFHEGKAIQAGNILLTNKYCRDLAALIINEIYDCIGDIGERHILAVGILRPHLFVRFHELVIIQAAIHSGSLSILWRAHYGIEMEPYELPEQLWDSEKNKGPLIDIWHILHHNDNASCRNLGRNYKSGQLNEKFDKRREVYERVIDYGAMVVSKFFDGEKFIWNANLDYRNEEGLLPNEFRLPPRAEGMDEWKSIHNVACLLAVNLPPPVANLISKYTGISHKELYQRERFAYVYQTIGRCSIRDRNANNRIKLIVLSRDDADKLAGLFAGARVTGQLGDLPRLAGMEKRSLPDIEKYGGWSKQRVAFAKYKYKTVLNGLMPLSKNDWWDNVRRPRLNEKRGEHEQYN
jgi:hypothetical protein